MISLVIPTRNRSQVLAKTAKSFFAQQSIDEIVVVNDGGSDESERVLRVIARDYPATNFVFIDNASRLGASQSRNVGTARAKNDFILFCDDDEILERDYARTCLRKLEEHGAAAVSGRRIYMRRGENPASALQRFGNGLRGGKFFRPLICEYVNGARFDGDLMVPFTNAVILTRKSLLLSHPFDPFYARGNGYREETDYQMNLYTRGHRIVVTNACHSFHLPFEEVATGGQRTGRTKRVYWSIYYTRYFYRKYWTAYAARQGLRAPGWLALSAFSLFAAYRTYIRPALYPIALELWPRIKAAGLLPGAGR